MDDAAVVAEPELTGDAGIDRRLNALGRVVPPPEIAELWVFPPLEEMQSSSEFLLFTRFVDERRRQVYSARMAPLNGHPARQVVVEHGCVPADRVPRLVGNMQRRLGEARQPVHLVIDGEAERWRALVDDGAAGAAGNGADPGGL